MSNQPAWARYGRLQGALMATSDRTAEITARWAAQSDDEDWRPLPSDQYAPSQPAGRRPAFPKANEPIASGPAATVDAAPEVPSMSEDRARAMADRFVALGRGPEVGRRFVLGGNAYLTLQGTEQRYTFRVAQGKPREGDSPDRSQPFFLSLLSGPDNTADYTYVGIVDASTGRVRLTRASRMREDSKPVAAWNWVMSRVFAGKPHAPATVHHAGRCGRCGRLLTVPSSIETGFGPECSGKLGE